MTSRNGSQRSQGVPASPPGIIDTVGNAFALLNRRPYLIWMPIVLDVMLWTGFRVSVTDPLAWLVGNISALPPSILTLVEDTRAAISGADLTSFVVALVPTLLTDLDRGEIPAPGVGTASVVSAGGGSSTLLLIGCALLAVVIGTSYFTLIGRLVNDSPAWGPRFVLDCVTNAIRVCVLIVLVSALLVFLLTPFVALGLGLGWAGIDPTGLLVLAAGIVVLWALIFFGFSIHALAVGVTRPVEALRSSYVVVYQNLVAVLGLFAIVLVIRAGTPIALQLFTESRWSVPFAIVANAYIGTALIAATMLFYRDRRPAIGFASASETSG